MNYIAAMDALHMRDKMRLIFVKHRPATLSVCDEARHTITSSIAK